MIEHKELLRKWLREKGYHRDDIASALAYRDEHVKNGNKLTDKIILKICDDSHKVAISKAVLKVSKGKPVLVRYVNKNNYMMLMFGAIFGAISGACFYEFRMEIFQWVLEMMQSAWLQMGLEEILGLLLRG